MRYIPKHGDLCAMSSGLEDFPAFSVLSTCEMREEDGFVHYLGLAVPVVGGAPGPRENPDLDVLDWRPPGWLARVYGVHQGLGVWFGRRDRWVRHAILPWDEVTPLTRHVRFGEENIRFDTADCVLIAPDGRGGGLVLEGREAPRVRRFWAEDHALSDPWPVERALQWVTDGWSAG